MNTKKENVNTLLDKIFHGEGLNDEELKKIISLRKSISVTIEDKQYSLGEITALIHSAESMGFNRWGGLWLANETK